MAGTLHQRISIRQQPVRDSRLDPMSQASMLRPDLGVSGLLLTQVQR